MEWLAAMCSHIPNKGEQMVRYYGHYSNVSRGKRQKAGTDDALPCILEPQGDEKTFRRNWARLIQKIYGLSGYPDMKSTLNSGRKDVRRSANSRPLMWGITTSVTIR